MANRSDDRRTQRTRRALMSAFVELVLSRGYEAVSVGEITGKANVGRSTFYLHYTGKKELLEDSLKFPSSALVACVTGTVTPQALSPLLEHFHEQRGVNRAFFEYPIRAIWVKSLASLIEPCLPMRGMRSPLPRSLIALLVAEMQVALITHWLAGKFALKSVIVAATLIASTRSLLDGIGSVRG
jgi:AcrR family transcriptional regulator